MISVSVYNLEPRKQNPAGTRRHTSGRQDRGQPPRPRIERSNRRGSATRRKPGAPSGTKNGHAGGVSETSQADDDTMQAMHQMMSIQEGIPMGFQVSLNSGRVRDMPRSARKERLNEALKTWQDPGLCRAPTGTIEYIQRPEITHPTMLPSTETSLPMSSAPQINDKYDPDNEKDALYRGIGSLRPPGFR